jgi:hypothetical protein
MDYHKNIIVFERTEEEFFEKFVQALHKHTRSYMMPFDIYPLREGAVFDSHNQERNDLMIAHATKEHEEGRALIEWMVRKIISELRGHPVERNDKSMYKKVKFNA